MKVNYCSQVGYSCTNYHCCETIRTHVILSVCLEKMTRKTTEMKPLLLSKDYCCYINIDKPSLQSLWLASYTTYSCAHCVHLLPNMEYLLCTYTHPLLNTTNIHIFLEVFNLSNQPTNEIQEMYPRLLGRGRGSEY